MKSNFITDSAISYIDAIKAQFTGKIIRQKASTGSEDSQTQINGII